MTDNAGIASRIRQQIDDYCLVKFQQDRRSHLGASEIGEECKRRQWYLFRWIKQKQFNARMRRLFETGHREEERFIDYLRGVGFRVYSIDPNTQKQILFSDHAGHYGGSTDSVVEHDVFFPGEYLIAEYKTYKEKYFKKLQKEGVKRHNPKHYAQMSEYGARLDARRGLYFAKNKNDDELHLEIVDLDYALAEHLSNKALEIITATVPPQRMNNASPTFFACKTCESLGVCFYKEPPDRNCRSCSNAWPQENAEWHCSRWQANIPKDVIPVGCPEYRPIV